MPRRRTLVVPANVKCTVIGCTCEWIMVSKNRHYYCHKHMVEANTLYKTYKAINADAIITFDDDKLSQTITLREKYAREYLDYEDKGSHLKYVNILKEVLLENRGKEQRKEIYNKLMTKQFADFQPVV